MSLQHVKALNATGFVDSSRYLETNANVNMGNSPVVPMLVKLYRDETGVVTVDINYTQLTTTISTGSIFINFTSPTFNDFFKSTLTQQDLVIGLDSASPRYYGGVLRVFNSNTWTIYREDFLTFAAGTHTILDATPKYRIN